jgi:hypothetical protein
MINLVRGEGRVNGATKSSERASFRFVGRKRRAASSWPSDRIFGANKQSTRLFAG